LDNKTIIEEYKKFRNALRLIESGKYQQDAKRLKDVTECGECIFGKPDGPYSVYCKRIRAFGFERDDFCSHGKPRTEV